MSTDIRALMNAWQYLQYLLHECMCMCICIGRESGENVIGLRVCTNRDNNLWRSASKGVMARYVQHIAPLLRRVASGTELLSQINFGLEDQAPEPRECMWMYRYSVR